MQGRVGCVSPEFIIRNEGSWFGRLVFIDRMTQMSSMQRAILGKISLTSIPASPCLANLYGEGISLPLLRRIVLMRSFGGSCPAYFSRAGFGSNVSTCDGPPFMNRWITALARGGKCGALGASGF